MNGNLSNKVVVIGGIGGGIGSALARRLSESGCQIAGFGRSTAKLGAVTDELDGIHTATVDATHPFEIDTFLADVKSNYGQIDAYVHAIGSIFLKPAHLTGDDDWANTLQINLSTAFFALRSCTKLMQKQGHGSCVFFSTAAAQAGIANHEAIAAAKGGIDAMIRSAAATYAPRGVRINAIAPSLTATPLAKPIIGSEQALEISKRMHPLGDIAQADEVASLAAWLVSDDARLVTGQTFVLDGGISTIVPKPRA